MNIKFKLNFEILFVLSYLCSCQVNALDRRGYSRNVQAVRKASYSYSIIIFFEDDDEPLLPIPTFNTPTKSVAIGDSDKTEARDPITKRPTVISQSKIDKNRVRSKNETILIKPVNPAAVTKQPTTKITVNMKKRINSGSVNQPVRKPIQNQNNRNQSKMIPDNFEEPILQGSYYVPFKEMRNSTSTT